MFESLFAVTLLIGIIVPGFVYQRTKSRFFLTAHEKEVEIALISYAIHGMAITALSWPLTNILGQDPIGLMLAAADGKAMVRAIQESPIGWLLQLFFLPSGLAIAGVYLARLEILKHLPEKMRLKPLAKEPNAVEKMVHHMEKYKPLVQILLRDGQKVYAGMEIGSAVSLSAPYPDMFLHPLFSVDETTKQWTQAPGNTAIFIRGSDIRLVVMYTETQPVEGKDITP